MLEQGLELVKKYRNFLTYAVIGCSGAGLDLIIFLFLVHWTQTAAQLDLFFPIKPSFMIFGSLHTLSIPVGMFLCNSLSVSMGIANNFVLNAWLNFKVKDRLLSRFLKFYSVGLIGLVLSNGILWVMTTGMGLPEGLAKFVSIFVIVLVQFNLNKVLAFGKTP